MSGNEFELSYVVIAGLALLFLVQSLSFYFRPSVLTAADLAGLLRDAQRQLDEMAQSQAQEREQFRQEIFRLTMQVTVLTERLRAAGIDFQVQELTDARVAMYEQMLDALGMSDMQDIAFKMHIDWEILEGDDKRDKARALFLLAERLNRLDELRIFCQQANDTVVWPRV